jgi:hypothetical protein
MNPLYYKGEWDEPGALIISFVIGLTHGSWNPSIMYNESGDVLENWIYNHLTGYYFMLMDIMILQDEHGKSLELHSIHTTTIANSLSNSGHALARATYWPPKAPFSPHHTREWAEECHYGNVKSKNAGAIDVLHLLAYVCHSTYDGISNC